MICNKDTVYIKKTIYIEELSYIKKKNGYRSIRCDPWSISFLSRISFRKTRLVDRIKIVLKSVFQNWFLNQQQIKINLKLVHCGEWKRPASLGTSDSHLRPWSRQSSAPFPVAARVKAGPAFLRHQYWKNLMMNFCKSKLELPMLRWWVLASEPGRRRGKEQASSTGETLRWRRR